METSLRLALGRTGPTPEASVLVRPAATFRELAQEREDGMWVLVRRPLLLVLVIGCVVALQAGGRLSVRLIADGILSFAFAPLFEIVSLAIIARFGRRPLPFARLSDLFFVGNAPWLLWMFAFAAIRCFQTRMQATALPTPLFWGLLGSIVPFAIWTACIDFHFFRQVLQRSRRRAAGDLILERAIAWSCGIAYFLGHALWPPSAW